MCKFVAEAWAGRVFGPLDMVLGCWQHVEEKKKLCSGRLLENWAWKHKMFLGAPLTSARN